MTERHRFPLTAIWLLLLALAAALVLIVAPGPSQAAPAGPPGSADENAPVAHPRESEIAVAPVCSVVDPGPKGLQVHPNEIALQALKIQEAGTGWVRIEFRAGTDGTLDLLKYDSVIDTLCAHNIAVIGLVDYVTIPDDLDKDGVKDYNDPDDYVAYQQAFTETLAALATRYQGRIHHWEIWNEENGLQWHVRPEYYARLLVASSAVVKAADPSNQVLFGGLDHVWVTSQYLEPVYDALDLDWGGARPFDILGVHPYFVRVDGEFILDPNVYLWDGNDPSRTILNTYLDYLASRGDGDVDIWVTEIGWNSALDNPAIANCPGIAAWCVDRTLQARYLADSFDILYSQVQDPLGNRDRVKRIVWYKFLDSASPVAEIAAKMSMRLNQISSNPLAVCPDDWGLVDGNRAPKYSYWSYQLYPQRKAAWQIASFTATPQPASVLVAWSTASEIELLGFHLYRAESPDGDRAQLNAQLIPAKSGDDSGATYEFVDQLVSGITTYEYYLEGVSADTTRTLYGPVHAAFEGDEIIEGLQATNDSPTPLGMDTTFTATITAGTGVVYDWAFGDGATGSGAIVSHAYLATGTYTATVTASNDSGQEKAMTRVIVHDPGRTCWARLNDSLTDYATVQAAVDASTRSSDIIKVSGTCTGTHSYTGLNQQVYLSKPLTIRGGYDASFGAWDPQTYSTTLDALASGRVFYLTGSISVTLEHLRITNGAASGLGGSAGDNDAGGNLYASSARLNLRNCDVSAGVADLGGGLYATQSPVLSLTGNLFSANQAGSGAAIHLVDSDASLLNNLIIGNAGADPASGSLDVESSTVRLLHTTIAGNSVGVGIQSGTLGLTNTILVSNTVGIIVQGGLASLEATLWGSGDWSNDTDWDGTGSLLTGTVNLWAEPGFADPGADDYHLALGSAALDGGVDTGPGLDIDGDPRPFGAGPDLGADERASVEATIDPVSGGMLTATVQGFRVTVGVPPAAVTQPAILRFSALATSGHSAPSGFAFAGLAFDLDAFRDGTRLPGFAFGLPVEVRIDYPADAIGSPDQTQPYLFTWDENDGGWEDAAGSCAPPSAYTRGEAWLSVPICHLSRFGLFADTHRRVYTPWVARAAR